MTTEIKKNYTIKVNIEISKVTGNLQWPYSYKRLQLVSFTRFSRTIAGEKLPPPPIFVNPPDLIETPPGLLIF